MSYVKILVPVDFSYHANGAVRLAVYLANRWQADVAILHVDPLPGVSAMTVEPMYIAPQLFEGLHAEHDVKVEAELNELRSAVADRAGAGVEIMCVRRRGEAVPGILEFADEWSADLIVMGSQGSDGIGQLLLGSTADEVSRVAPCPVLIAGRADDASDTPRRFERVIAAVDYSEFSAPVAQAAAAVVEPDGVVELAHVWNPPYLSALSSSLGGEHAGVLGLVENARAAQADDIQSFQADLHSTHERFEHYIAAGSPATELLVRARDSQADLLVLGAHSRTGLGERILGTVADRVLRYATTPVLLCPRASLPDQPTDTPEPTP